MKLLLIEDDVRSAEFVVRGFREQGHVVLHAANGKDGLHHAIEEKHDVIIIDRMLPMMDGLTILKTLREARNATPVLLLTTKGGIGDRVEGLEAGAGDYLVKPYAFSELNARVNALARRPPISDEITVLRFADLEMNLLKRTVTRGATPVDLQPREFQLLEYLLRHADQIVTRTMLLEAVWDYHFDPKTNIVETHISRLRAKLNAGSAADLIQTLRGSGYSLRAPV